MKLDQNVLCSFRLGRVFKAQVRERAVRGQIAKRSVFCAR